ncbi:hypothetical protein GCM10009654_41900 [Streptomyces hebeiensis]|uniref:Uncharacterized protein n=1 Tax=Streptomyces hebeiensis TaxID=229486 RepID=A0ABP4FHR4_9ACTN
MREWHAQCFGQVEEFERGDAAVAGLYADDGSALQIDSRSQLALAESCGKPRLSDALTHFGPALHAIHVCDFSTPYLGVKVANRFRGCLEMLFAD